MGQAKLTFTGKENPGADVVFHTVSFDSQGGGDIPSQSVVSGMKAVEPKEPFKAGYEFFGWTLNGEAYDFTEPVTGDIELVAVYE